MIEGRNDVVLRRSATGARSWRPLLAGLFAFVLPSLAAAQTTTAMPEGVAVNRARPTASQMRARTWDDRDGLPQNAVQALAQTPDGYMWMGTQEGLARFDGNRFVTLDRHTDAALSRPYIWSLHADADNTLWIGTEEAGIVRKRGDRYERYDTAQGLPHNWVNAIARGRSGTLWVGTMAGVARLVADRFEAIDTVGMPAAGVTSLLDDGRGGVWTGTYGGLAHVDAQGRVTSTFTGLPAAPVWDVVEDVDGTLLVATAQGVFRHTGDASFAPLAGLGDVPMGNLAVHPDGTIWGTAGSTLYRRDDDGTVTTRLLFPGGMIVSDLMIDREGSLWVGTYGRGATRLRATPMMPIGQAEGLASEMVHAVLETRNGDIWVGTGGSGVNRMSGDSITHFTAQSGQLAGNFIIGMREARDGSVFVAGNGGFSRIRADGSAQLFKAADGIPAPYQVRDVLEARDGTIWLAMPTGLLRFAPGEPRLFTRADGLPDDFVLSLIEAPDGAIWIGLRRGLARLAGGRLEAWDTTDGMTDGATSMMHLDREGALWLVGSGLGLTRRAPDGTFRSWLMPDGLCEDITAGIAEAENGDLWLSSNRGIFRVTRADLAAYDAGRLERLPCRLYARESGMRAREANAAANPAALRARDGRLWFPTIEGIVVVDPTRLSLQLPPPPVYVESVVADGRMIAGDAPVIPAGARNVEFRFSAPTFVSPELARFRYRLEGFDPDWIDAGNRHSAFYTNLPPGRYRFLVKAANAEGTWNDAGASLDVRMAPLFWQTWWFRALVTLALLALLVLLYRTRVRSLQRRQRELEDLVTERSIAEARWRELFESATDAVFATDLDGRVTAFNRTAEEMTGLRRGDVLGRDVRELVPADLRAALEWPPAHDERDAPFELRTRDDRSLRVELATRALVENGTPVGVLAVCRDMREREQLEGQLRQSQKMEAVGKLAGGVAHDFNNLLTVIQGNGELLMSEFEKDDPRRNDVAQIVEASHRASALTRQLLAFSRKQVDQPRVFELGALVAGLEPMLRRLLGEQVAIIAIPPERPAHVRADPAQMEQVVINLAVNARDAMPGGGTLTIETTTVELDDRAQWAGGPPAGRYALLVVADTGQGMDAATQARIFEPFFTTKEQGRGTGLGLSTVYGIVDSARGHIRVVSEPGAGTTFRVYLPLAAAASDDDTLTDGPETVPGGDETILLVEDEDAVRALTARVLRRLGYTVVEARHGRDALARAEAHARPIDLLVTDVVLPEMSGGRVAEMLRTRQPELRVLFMSGYTDDELVRDGVDQPGVAFLQKPFSAAQLARAVRAMLATAGGGAAS
ncbi:MAG TPA: two-component regulator propeller domain-containing protein [Longimicrobiales bacterium]